MRSLNEELEGLQELGVYLEAENARLQKEYDDVERAAFARYMRPYWGPPRSFPSPAPAGD